MKKSIFTSIFLIGLTLTSACTPQSISTVPQKGSSTDYWASFSADIGSQKLDSTFLINLETTETDPNINVILTPKFMKSNDINSAFLKDSHRKIARLGEGISLTFDSKTNELLDFGFNNSDAQKELEREKEKIAPLIKSLLPSLYITDIPTTKGSTVQLPEFNGIATTLKITDVTDQNIYISIMPQNPNSELKTYTKGVLSRETGQIKSLTSITLNDFKSGKRKSQIRNVFVMEEKTDKPPIDIKAFNYYDAPSEFIDFDTSNEQPPLGQQPIAKLNFHKGAFDLNSQKFRAGSIISGNLSPKPADIWLTNIKAFDEDNKPLDIDFYKEPMQEYEANKDLYMFNITPVGWDKKDVIKKIDKLTATASVYSHTYQKHDVTFKENETLSLDGLKVNIKPIPDLPLGYKITYQGDEHTWVIPFFGMSNHLVSKINYFADAKNDYPKWLTRNERKLLDLNNPEFVGGFEIQLKEKPSNFTFYTVTNSPAPIQKQEVSYVTTDAYNADPMLPPVRSPAPLVAVSYNENKPTAPFDIDKLNATKPNSAKATITLPPEWIDICQLEVIGDHQINGHKLVWLPDSEPRYYQGNKQPKRYSIKTDDNIQDHFYDINITSKISCDGYPSWEKLNYTANNEHPWLIPLSQLGEFDHQMSYVQFARLFRFTGTNDDEQFNVETIKSNGKSWQDDNEPIADAIVDGKYLRLRVAVDTIQKLNITEEPIEREFKVIFPPLPTE